MSSATQATVTYIDDADPGFVYKGNWQNVNSTLADIGDGVHVSSTNGSSVSYSFNGTEIKVVCVTYLPTNSSKPPTITFTLDDGSPLPFQPVTSANGTSAPYFSSPELSSDEHTLVIQLIDNAPFYLDGVIVQGLPASQASGGAQIPASSFSAPPNVATAPVGKTSSGSKAPVGPIVGGVVGGVALLVGALLAVWFLCWRGRGNKRPYYYGPATADDMLAPEEKAAAAVTPYPPSVPPQSVYSDSPLVVMPASVYGGPNIVPYAPSSVGGSSSDREREGDTASMYSAAPSRAMTVLSVANTATTNMSNLTVGQRKAMEAGLRTIPESSGLQHADSGIRFDQNGEASGSALPPDAPPVYTAA